jgi:hypothetical protein
MNLASVRRICPKNLRILTLSYFRHKAINIFLRTYQELWLSDENVGQEVIIEDLTVI